MTNLCCKSIVDYILDNSVLSLIIGLLLGVGLTAWSTHKTNKFNEKMWIKDKRLYYYSKSLDDIKKLTIITRNINTGFYGSQNGIKAKNEDFKEQKALMEDYFTQFKIIAEPDVFSLYEKIYSTINLKQCNNFDELIDEYEEKISISIMKGFKK